MKKTAQRTRQRRLASCESRTAADNALTDNKSFARGAKGCSGLLTCSECQWYRPQWKECAFGGGWGHYPEPTDECARGFEAGGWNQ